LEKKITHHGGGGECHRRKYTFIGEERGVIKKSRGGGKEFGALDCGVGETLQLIPSKGNPERGNP